MTIESKQTQKGFTLIELMIVVAIIGILASIAIPQFSQFRVKAYNSASLSDLHSARLAQEVVYTDYQTYGGSVAAGALTLATALVAAPEAGVNIIAGPGFIATATAGMAAPVTASTGVTLKALASAVASSVVQATAASIAVQHASGDKLYVTETDQPGIYQQTVVVGTAFPAAPITAVDNVLDATAVLKFVKMK